MDKEQARFILQSFRPDGSDAGDHDFADALRLAMENRELGEWLAHERAFDAAFAEALGAVDLPQHLRDDILTCLAVERGDFPQAEDAEDAQWIGLLATLQPPPALRDQILAAMDRTAAEEPAIVPDRGKVTRLRWLAIPLAAAAALALGIFVTRESAPKPTIAHVQAVSLDAVRSEVIHTLKTHGSIPEEPVPGPAALAKYLADRNMPRLATLPEALQQMKGFACRELVMDGKHGTLICFEGGKKNRVHLVVFRREDVKGDFPNDGRPAVVQDGEWASARWADGDNVAMMVSNTKAKNLSALF